MENKGLQSLRSQAHPTCSFFCTKASSPPDGLVIFGQLGQQPALWRRSAWPGNLYSGGHFQDRRGAPAQQDAHFSQVPKVLAFVTKTSSPIDTLTICIRPAHSLNDNYMKAQGASHMAEMLKVNSTITSIRCLNVLALRCCVVQMCLLFAQRRHPPLTLLYSCPQLGQ